MAPTAPARLAGRRKRRAIDGLTRGESRPELLALARRGRPTLFHAGELIYPVADG